MKDALTPREDHALQYDSKNREKGEENPLGKKSHFFLIEKLHWKS